VRRNRLLRYAAALVSAALLVTFAPVSHAAKPKVAFKPYRVNGQPIRAIALTNIRQFAALSIPDLNRIKSDGFNMVTIYAYRFLSSSTDNTQAVGAFTEPDAVLAKTISAAHLVGLQVQLIPTIWVGPGYGAFYWRGAVHPTNTHAFFNSYRDMTNHYAAFATKNKVELFGVGSEMSSLQSYESEWRQTIGETRQLYKGPITYFAVYAVVGAIKWWNAIDYPGVSPYMSLASADLPTYNDIANGWNKVHLPYLRKISAYVGKPLLVAEIGYASAPGAATHPERAGAGPAQPALQASLYQAFLDIVLRDKALDGVSFFYWSAYEAGPTDSGFSPKGKAAECFLAKRWAPAGTTATQCNTAGLALL
jgi:hypothetical protein